MHWFKAPVRLLGFVVFSALGIGALGSIPAEAAFPGTPGPILYSKVAASEIETSGGLFFHGPRASQAPHRLTSDPQDRNPSYSPNGRLIAFEGNRDPGETSGTHIYVMKADGSGVVQLTNGDFYDSNPAFSANGEVVVFDRAGLSDRVTHIFAVVVDGSGLRQLTRGPDSDYEPSFTPNGRRIVFVSGRGGAGRRDRSNIFSMKPNGTQVKLLIGGPRNDYEPDISPNGRLVAFASTRANGHGPNLFVARIDGSHVRALTHSKGDCFRTTCYGYPSFAPDGRHIAFLRSGRYASDLEVIRTDGRGYSKEFDEAGTEEEGYGSHIGPPSWGPSG